MVFYENAIDPDLANEVKNHVLWLGEKYPDIRSEAFHHHLLIHDPFFVHSQQKLRIPKRFIGIHIKPRVP